MSLAPLMGEGREGGERRYSNASGEQGAVGISNSAQEGVKRGHPTMAESLSDGEEEYTGCCLFRSRSMYRKPAKGASYSRLESDEPETTNAKPKSKSKLQRSRSVWVDFCCCCGPYAAQSTNYTVVEVRSVDTKQDRKWEVDVNEDHCNKPPYWRQLIRKLTSHGHVRRPSRGSDWFSYDAQAYQMNFDDGCGRETCVSYLFTDENDDAAARARAMHAALLKKFASKGDTGSTPGSPMSPILSPLPVKMMSKEEIEKSKQGCVPIWQRRQGAPLIKLDLRQRSGPLD